MSTVKRSNSDENLINGLGSAAAGGGSNNLDALEGFGEIIEGPRASQRINLYETADSII